MVAYGAGVCGYNQTQDQPAPTHTPPPPPPHWTQAWGAIALYFSSDNSKAVLGSSSRSASQSQAEQAAIRDCQLKGGLECKIAVSFANQCAAVVAGNPGYYVTLGVIPATAANNGMTKCTGSGYTGCHVYYSMCSLPQEVQ
ncbi:DUF4189 domain-containing protein [Burkholderia cepacia]|uniref:DUF4189 domain-containing protein n=1 Tax=Burkholderia cepacia TaxID=292 RepID=UPI00158B88BE